MIKPRIIVWDKSIGAPVSVFKFTIFSNVNLPGGILEIVFRRSSRRRFLSLFVAAVFYYYYYYYLVFILFFIFFVEKKLTF